MVLRLSDILLDIESLETLNMKLANFATAVTWLLGAVTVSGAAVQPAQEVEQLNGLAIRNLELLEAAEPLKRSPRCSIATAHVRKNWYAVKFLGLSQGVRVSNSMLIPAFHE